MSNDFGGVDLALGSVLGWRDFGLTTEGVLTPITHSGQGDWMPGENLATCGAYVHAKQVGEQGDLTDEEYREKKREWADTHSMDECEHGFYAYFDGSRQQYTSGPKVRGVIEGYGEVLIGTLGFRAMKAKILALSVAPHDGMWKLDQFFVERLRANYPNVPLFESELAMRAEFPCPKYELEGVETLA